MSISTNSPPVTRRSMLQRGYNAFASALVASSFSGCNGRFGCDTEELRVAANPWPGYSFIFLAEELGFFREANMNVRLFELESLVDVRRVFEQGLVDLCFCTLAEVILMNSETSNPDIQVINALDYSNGADMLLAHSDVRDLADLKDRRIGVEPGSVSGLCVSLALDAAQVTRDQVTLVPLSNAEMLEAMKNRFVDVVQIYPPHSDAIETIDGVHRLWDTSDEPRIILDVLATRQATSHKRASDIHSLLLAYDRAQQFYFSQPEVAISILANRFQMGVDELRRSFLGMTILTREATETNQIFAPQDSRRITARVAGGLEDMSMLSNPATASPFDSAFIVGASR